MLLNYPGAGVLKITRPTRADLIIIELPIPADKDSAGPDAFPAFHGYGISGDVTGQVVYANYGRLRTSPRSTASGSTSKGRSS